MNTNTIQKESPVLISTGSDAVRWKPLAFVVLMAAGIWFVPVRAGIDERAWHLFAIFVATILGLIVKPLPLGAVALLGITATAVTGTLSIDEALSGFGNRVIWLIVIAFFISRGFIKTGLGSRIAYLFMAAFGKRTLGLAYGLVATDLVLSPAIPSNTARAGAVIFPIVRSVAKSYGSEPNDGTARTIGSFLITASFQGNVITSAMFLTAMAANPLAATLAKDVGVQITWGVWALAALVPGLISLAVVPWLLYVIYPPAIKETASAPQLALGRLREMGKVKPAEYAMLITFVLLLLLWIFGNMLGIESTTAAFVGLGVLLVSGTLSWEDILQESGAWNTLLWTSALVMMATYLNKLGFIPWFGHTMSGAVHGCGWVTAFLIISLSYFYSHYLFASNTAHVSSMYGAFLAVAVAAGTPPLLAALVLGFFSNLFGSMTHYGTGPAPVLFGAGYVEMGTWWKLGGLVSVVNIVIWLGIGGLWWKVIGVW